MGVLGGGWVARSSGGSWVWNLKSSGLAEVSFLGPFPYESASDVVDHLEKIHGRDDSCCGGSLTSEHGLPNFEHGEVPEL